MPKQKSKRAARKRFIVTNSGHIKHAKQNRRHILAKKPTKRKRIEVIRHPIMPPKINRKGEIFENKAEIATIKTMVQE